MLIFGVGEYAAVADFYLKDGPHRIHGFTVDVAKPNQLFHGKQVIDWKDASSAVSPYIFVAIGPSNLNRNRAAKLEEARARGFCPERFISTAAHIFSRDIGEHCFILEANVIQPFVSIGNNVVIWSANHIGHHTRIGSNCWITSGCVISGGCDIGNNAFIGVNASIADHVKVGSHAIITMGSRVTKDVPDFGVWDGDGLRKMSSERVRL